MDFHEIFRIGRLWHNQGTLRNIWGDDRFNPLDTGFIFLFFYLGPCLLAISRKKRWMAIHKIAQRATGYTISRQKDFFTLSKLGVAVFWPLGVLLVLNVALHHWWSNFININSDENLCLISKLYQNILLMNPYICSNFSIDAFIFSCNIYELHNTFSKCNNFQCNNPPSMFYFFLIQMFWFIAIWHGTVWLLIYNIYCDVHVHLLLGNKINALTWVSVSP